MTILLTGGSGFLGSHIAEQLSQAGRKVRALVRPSSDTRLLRGLAAVELCEGDLDDVDSLRRAARGTRATVHAAGLVKARYTQELHRVNAQGTRNLLEALVEVAPDTARLVLVSSLSAAGPSDVTGQPRGVADTEQPVSEYGLSKLAGEIAARARQHEIPVTVLRPPLIYGPRDRESLAFFKAVRWRVWPAVGAPDARLSILYATDAAAASIAAIDAPLPSGITLFVDDGAVHTRAELVAALEESLDRRVRLQLPLPPPLLRAVAMVAELVGRLRGRAVMLSRDKCPELQEQWVCDSSATPAKLGWRPRVDLQQGARRAAEWYRREGWL